MEMILLTFPQKILFGANVSFRNGFSEKNLIWDTLVILTEKWYVFITLDLLSGFF